MTAGSSSLKKKSIRPHRKSRTGCSFCKRRKVKCNEGKPCSNCRSFGLPCDLVSDAGRVEYGTVSAPRRGPGRPRKVWTDTPNTPPPISGVTSPQRRPLAVNVDSAQVNLGNAELLLHFITTTTETFAAGPDDPDILQFWKRNVPHIGLSHAFVLHLILATAAFHLAYLAKEGDQAATSDPQAPLPLRRSRSDYVDLAHQHFTVGLSGFSSQLSQAGPENCGALYLAAVLTSYCTFAAGPTSCHDVLVCTVHERGRQDTTQDPFSIPPLSMPFIQGVRLMRQCFSPDVLFAGLMKPLGPVSAPPGLLEQPVYAGVGFPRLDWEDALDRLRAFIASARPNKNNQEDAAAASLRALDCLIDIYEATYGRRSGLGDTITYRGSHVNQFVFGWLYRVEPGFVACVRKGESLALLVLAHYAVLLNMDAVQKGWYIEGWKDHIIAVVDGLVGDGEFKEFLMWPMETHFAERGNRERGELSGLDSVVKTGSS
ncbi:hypothetical protein N657DRAFT_687272 [Parathielavia appendiculata]|uniref:Zn(2)-C6 fungal-type domain-containing protein n=1 Tax=Parathielavia appendiculata TaxID=2587402 RepID=A0AAN6U5R1_9PEZI|nr:hypothetical protein N657DRAFT_687272 [Parathielavia appendiculata]